MNEQKFWSSMDKDPITGCWNWSRAIGSGGYGQVSFRGTSHGAHRLAWELRNGKIPAGSGGYHGTVVAHRCDNRRCCNPGHLFLTDASGNQRDCLRKGRATAAKLTEDQVKEIISLIQSGVSASDLAQRYGVFTMTIRSIAKRVTWRHLTEDTGELSFAPRQYDSRKWRKADYDLIGRLLKENLSYREIAKRAGTTHTTVRRVVAEGLQLLP